MSTTTEILLILLQSLLIGFIVGYCIGTNDSDIML